MACICELTIPIKAEGYWITEFDVQIEYVITYGGKNVTYLSPAEGPEWEVEDIRLVCSELRATGTLFNHLPKATGCLLGYVEDYLSTPIGREDMIQMIEEEMYAR